MSEARKSSVVWGMALLGIGLFLIIFGVIFWVGIGVFGMWEPTSEFSALENLSVSGVCCFGPFAFIGGIMAIIGGVLWWTHRH